MKLISFTHALVALALLSISIGRAAPAPTPTPVAADFSHAQKYLQVFEWTAGASRRFTLADNVLVTETPDPKAAEGTDPFLTGTQKSTTVSAPTAAAAWEKIAKLEIPKWRGIYDSRDLGQEDPGGTEWSVDLRIGKDKKHSRGNNAFPGSSPIGIPTLGGGGGRDPETAYTELLAILEALGSSST